MLIGDKGQDLIVSVCVNFLSRRINYWALPLDSGEDLEKKGIIWRKKIFWRSLATFVSAVLRGTSYGYKRLLPITDI